MIEIRPIVKERYHGLTAEQSIDQPVVIHATVDPVTRRYRIDIPEERLKKLSEITGYDLDTRFKDGVEHQFFDTKLGSVELPNHTILLNPESPFDELKIGIARAHNWVAKSASTADYNCTHYLYDEDKEIIQQATKSQKRMKAAGLAAKMSASTKVAMIRILDGKNFKGRTDDVIDAKLMYITEGNPEQFIAYAEKDVTYLVTLALVEECILQGIIVQNGTRFETDSGEILGFDKEAVINYLLEPANQPLLLNYKNRIGE